MLAPVLVVVNLQYDATNESGWPATILDDYCRGTIGDLWTDGVSPAIIRARILMRILLLGLSGGASVSLSSANLFLQTLFLGAGCFAVYSTTKRDLKLSDPYPFLAVLLALSFLTWGFLGVGYSISYPYDLPAFYFSAIALKAVYRQKPLVFGITLFLGTLNKETLVFLIPAYVWMNSGFDFQGLWQVKTWRTALALGLVYALAYFLPRWYITSGAIPVTASTASGQDLRIWSNLAHLTGGNGWSLFQNFFWIVALHLPAMFWFRRLPRPMRTVYACSPVFLIPQLIFGNINELRLFNELVPLGALSAVYLFFHRPTGSEIS